MKNNTKLYLLSALLSAPLLADTNVQDSTDDCDATICHNDWNFDFGFNSMRQMHKRMITLHNQMLDEMESLQDELFSSHSATKQPAFDLNIESDATHVHIKLTNLHLTKDDAEKIDVMRRGSVIKVMIPAQDGNIMEMQIDQHAVLITSKYEQKQEQKNDTDVSHIFHSSGIMRMTRSLPYKVNLTDVNAIYDEKTNTLTISIAKNADEIEQRIKVTAIN